MGNEVVDGEFDGSQMPDGLAAAAGLLTHLAKDGLTREWTDCDEVDQLKQQGVAIEACKAALSGIEEIHLRSIASRRCYFLAQAEMLQNEFPSLKSQHPNIPETL